MMIPPFTVRIRWRSTSQERWEVDTEHGGFRTVEDAALWANGLSARGAKSLRLASAEMWVELNNGERVAIGLTQIAAWHQADENHNAGDDGFERLDRTIVDLSSEGLDGWFTARKFRVLDAEGALDIKIEVDTNRRVVLLSIAESPVATDDDDDVLGRIPRA